MTDYPGCFENTRDLSTSQMIFELMARPMIDPELLPLLEKELDYHREREEDLRKFREENPKIVRQLETQREMEKEAYEAEKLFWEEKFKKEEEKRVFRDLALSIQENEAAEEAYYEEKYGNGKRKYDEMNEGESIGCSYFLFYLLIYMY